MAAEVKRKIVEEAEILLSIAKTLEPFTDEKRCQIMAAVTAHYGFYREAKALLEAAESMKQINE